MILSDFVLRKQNARAPCAALPVEMSPNCSELDRRMDRGARLGVNQGEAEGVDFCPRLKLNPQICFQDCPRGAAAARFLWDSYGFFMSSGKSGGMSKTFSARSIVRLKTGAATVPPPTPGPRG